jgi:hypothetical protein
MERPKKPFNLVIYIKVNKEIMAWDTQKSRSAGALRLKGGDWGLHLLFCS